MRAQPNRRTGRPAALRAQGQARHLPVPVRRPVADGSVRLQAALDGVSGHRSAGLDPHGPAADGNVGDAAQLPGRAVEVQLRAARAIRAHGSANCCRTRRRSPTTSRSSSRCTPRRSITIRRSRSSRPASQLAGRPSMGAWVSYGLGSENEDLPAFVVMISPGQGGGGQPLYDRLWGSGFLPTRYQGVKFRSVGDPVLYLSNPQGFPAREPPRLSRRAERAQRSEPRGVRRSGDRDAHRAVRDGVSDADVGAGADGPLEGAAEHVRSVRTGCAQAGHFRGQLPAGAAAGRARRALHPALSIAAGTSTASFPKDLPKRCKETDQPSAALIQDLKQRGMLDDTLVVWGGEFGRTVYCQGRLTDGRLRPRSSSALLHDVDGRRRHQARA